MITKNADFKGRFDIANAVVDEPNAVGNQEELQLFIDEFEPECLVTVLGYALYEELVPELDKLPWNDQAIETADQKWIDLVEGKDNYQGLKKLLVPFIYYHFLKDDDEHHTGVGVVRENPKGAERTPARKKAVTAWREYYKYTVGAQDTPNVFAKYTVRGPVTGIIYGNSDDKFWSLYNFMYNNEDVYTNWSPSKVSNITLYGI